MMSKLTLQVARSNDREFYQRNYDTPRTTRNVRGRPRFTEDQFFCGSPSTSDEQHDKNDRNRSYGRTNFSRSAKDQQRGRSSVTTLKLESLISGPSKAENHGPIAQSSSNTGVSY